MKVTFYFRHPDKLNRSIERVFDFVSSGLKNSFGVKVDTVFAKACRIWPLALCYNVLRMGFISRKKGIHHITGDIHYASLLMPKDRTILTVHDLVSIHNSELNPMFKRFVYYLWYYYPLKHLKYVTCVSEATKQDLIQYFPFAQDKVMVIPNPIPDGFTAMKASENNKPIILHIGTRSNKNLERVIKALAHLDCHLRIIGRLTVEQEELLRETNLDFSNVYGISDEEMVNEYRKCDIISFPSLFEGFGMPIIEGQACARIVVTSDLEPMKSISGGASILVNPEDEKSILHGFETALENLQLRQALIAKGLENARKYSINSIAAKYKELYDRIIQ